MNNRTKYISLFFMMVCSSGIPAANGTDGVSIRLKADDLVIVQAGEKIYQTQCASCHGAELEGQANWRSRDANGFLPAPPHDATGHTWHHADDQLFEITKYGPGAVINDSSYQTLMPAFKGILDDNDIVAVLSFIKNTWPEEERQWQEEVNGTQQNGIKSVPKTESTLLEKLLK